MRAPCTPFTACYLEWAGFSPSTGVQVKSKSHASRRKSKVANVCIMCTVVGAGYGGGSRTVTTHRWQGHDAHGRGLWRAVTGNRVPDGGPKSVRTQGVYLTLPLMLRPATTFCPRTASHPRVALLGRGTGQLVVWGIVFVFLFQLPNQILNQNLDPAVKTRPRGRRGGDPWTRPQKQRGGTTTSGLRGFWGGLVYTCRAHLAHPGDARPFCMCLPFQVEAIGELRRSCVLCTRVFLCAHVALMCTHVFSCAHVCSWSGVGYNVGVTKIGVPSATVLPIVHALRVPWQMTLACKPFHEQAVPEGDQSRLF